MDTDLLTATVRRYRIDSMSATDESRRYAHDPMIELEIRKSGLDLLMQDAARALQELQAERARAACPALQKVWDDYRLLLALTVPSATNSTTNISYTPYKGLYDKLSSN